MATRPCNAQTKTHPITDWQKYHVTSAFTSHICDTFSAWEADVLPLNYARVVQRLVRRKVSNLWRDQTTGDSVTLTQSPFSSIIRATP
jgi:hypothetical protein